MVAVKGSRVGNWLGVGAAVWGALVVGLASAPVSAQRAGAAEVLTNESIISMTSANVNKDLLVAKLNTTRNSFDVTVDGLINLTLGKVNQDVIKSMISAASNPKLGPPAPKTPEVLDNDGVIKLVGSKVQRVVVMAKIMGTKTSFDVTAAGLVSLTQAKVPNDVIQAMVVKGSGD